MTTAYKIARPDTAFSVGRPSTKKRPRDKAAGHLEFVRRLPCVACMPKANHAHIEAAHIRMASPIHGKRETGKAERPDDKWSLPLCKPHHEEQHAYGEEIFWGYFKLNPCDLALAIWGCTGDDDMAETIIRLQRERKK